MGFKTQPPSIRNPVKPERILVSNLISRSTGFKPIGFISYHLKYLIYQFDLVLDLKKYSYIILYRMQQKQMMMMIVSLLCLSSLGGAGYWFFIRDDGEEENEN